MPRCRLILVLLVMSGMATLRAGAQPVARYPNYPPADPYVNPRVARGPIAAPAANRQTPAGGQQNSFSPNSFQPTYQPSYQPAQISRLQPPQSVVSPAPQRASQVFEPAQIVAQVGGEYILAGDLLGEVNQMLEPHLDKIPEDQLNQQRKLLMKRMLKMRVTTKLAYLEFLREAPPEQVAGIEQNVYKEFNERRLETLVKQAKVESAAELDAKLRGYGSSLDKLKRMFFEQVIAQQVIRREVDHDPEITHTEMLDYYREQAGDYDVPAKARWEQLMTRFSKYPDKAAAYRALAEMGNAVYLRGAPLNVVAKRSSDGFNADKGGLHDWTTRGSLAEKALDEAAFSLPVGKLSQIIEGEQGFYIVRVLDRRDAGRVPFTDAQVEIKKKLREEKISAARKAYLEKLREITPVWTIFDNEDEP